MKRRLIMVLLGLLGGSSACQWEQTNHENNTASQPVVYLTPDTSHYAIMPLDSADLADYDSMGGSSGAFGVSLVDIARAEFILREKVAQYNWQIDQHRFTGINFCADEAFGRRAHRHIKLSAYYRQYRGVYSPAGHRLVLINGLCSPLDGWRKGLIIVEDGGNCFFFVAVDLTEPENTGLFSVHGEA
jgi:hypothetical protein